MGFSFLGRVLGEGDFGDGAFGFVGEFEEVALGESGGTGDKVGGDGLNARVVAGDAVVVGLTREGDFVFGGG